MSEMKPEVQAAYDEAIRLSIAIDKILEGRDPRIVCAALARTAGRLIAQAKLMMQKELYNDFGDLVASHAREANAAHGESIVRGEELTVLLDDEVERIMKRMSPPKKTVN